MPRKRGRRTTVRLATTRLTAQEAGDIHAAIEEAGVARRLTLDLANGRGIVYAVVGATSHVISTQERWAEFQRTQLSKRRK